MQPVQIRRDVNLATEPAVVARFPSCLQHAFLHVLARLEPREPRGIDVHVAGRAGAGAAALRHHALHAVLACRLHQRDTKRRVDLTPAAAGLREDDLGHYTASLRASSPSANLSTLSSARSAMSLRAAM